MKAIVYTKYGTPDVLRPEEVDKPTPGNNELLVKVHTASINEWDWSLLRGGLFINRLFFGLFRPGRRILGSDIAGRVEAVGKNVKQFKPGDEVFGDISGRWGGFAEYVCAPAGACMLKPAGMTFDEAAAIPQAALLALQGLQKAQVQPGQKVLINGAGGGTGTFAIQIAKAFGAEVWGVDRTEKLETMRSVGADHVIDFTHEDFARNGQRYDLILDVAAHRSIFDYKRVLNPGGMYVMVGGASGRIIETMLLGPLISLTGSRKMGILAHKPMKGMDTLIALFESAKVVPVIDRRYPLSGTAEAFRYFGAGRARGKVLITVA